jgi:hypothetical protein
MDGPVYRGEIHTAPVNNTDMPAQVLEQETSIYWERSTLIGCTLTEQQSGDQSLQAEVGGED